MSKVLVVVVVVTVIGWAFVDALVMALSAISAAL